MQAEPSQVRAAGLAAVIEAGFHSPNFVLSVQVLSGGTALYVEGAELDPNASELGDIVKSCGWNPELIMRLP